MLIDIHAHTSRYSSCAHATPEEMVEAAIGAGLQAIVFTEHHVAWPLRELRELRHSYLGIRILRGIEATSDQGRADILAIGVPDACIIEREMRPHALMRRIHEAGGVGVLAHPFRLAPHIPAEFLLEPPDAYELMSLNMPSFARRRAATLEAALPSAWPVAASDAHVALALGAYAIDTDQDVANEAELAAAIREGAFRMCVDQRRLHERYPHWQRIQERVRALDEQGAPYRRIRKETGYTRAIVRHVLSGGDLVR